MKNKFLAIIGGTVALFGLGYLIYVVLGFNAHNTELSETVFTKLDLPFIILMEVLYATLLTVIFSKWTEIKSFSSGAQAGLLIGAFIGACSTLELFATSELLELGGVVMAAITFGIRFAVAGGIIGYVLGRD
ncbi:hypothetical protein [Aestuariivivens sediminicola]|uniref:hypothetical protein n=1 Tax=Aestuariivivens sediminicola TaxID=2913560 RepID=UPI001F560069|nr:hypothetical protein [Aestuariivivens sediminicola]